MNKAEMGDRLAGRPGSSKPVTKDAGRGVFETIDEALANREEMRIAGFGTFVARSRAGPYRAQPPDGRNAVHSCLEDTVVQGKKGAQGHGE